MNPRRQDGFTLIEVLLATAILAVIVGMIYASFDQTAALSRHVDRVSDDYREARLVLSKFSDEIQSAFYYKDDPETRFEGSDGVGGDGFDADALSFTSMSRGFAGDVPASYHHGLEYRLTGDTLMYTETLNMLGTSPGNVQSFPLVEGLAGFRLRYLPPKGEEWVDAWEAGTGLPSAVEVTLLFPDTSEGAQDLPPAERRLLPLSTVIRVPMGEG